MKFSIAIPQSDPAVMRSFLPRAEALGFEGAWCIEQVIGSANCLESVTTLAYAAALTQRIKLGIAVLVLPQRAPIELAKSLSSLDVLSQGRLIVGLGLGGNHHNEAYGISKEHKVTRFREYLEALKLFWTEPRANFEGRFLQLKSLPMQPKPVQKPHPPVWLGGHAPAALERAVELGSGFMGAGSATLSVFLEELASIRKLLGTRSDFSLGKRLYLSVKNDLPRMREWFGEFYRKPEMADQVAVWGSPEKVVETLLQLREAGVNQVLLHPVTDEQEQLEILASEVIPRLR